MNKGPRESQAWQRKRCHKSRRERLGLKEHEERRAQMQREDNAFQAALRAAGVPEGISTNHTGGVPLRFTVTRADLLKSSIG